MNIITLFGSKTTAVSIPLTNRNDLLPHHPFTSIAHKTNAHTLFFLKQIHADTGYVLASFEDVPSSFVHAGDFIVTNKTNVGIGVITADCTPVIAYDIQKQAIGIAHAGWRGAVNGVVTNMVHALQKNFACDVCNLRIVVGPSARSCCYEVKHEVLERIDIHRCSSNGSLVLKNEQYFFDVPFFIKAELLACGILVDAIDLSECVCTICDERYCSYRREGSSAGRNVSVVCMSE